MSNENKKATEETLVAQQQTALDTQLLLLDLLKICVENMDMQYYS